MLSFSKNPARRKATPRAAIEKSVAPPNKRTKRAIFFERRMKTTVATSQIPKALRAIRPILPPERDAPLPKAETIPMTTARRTIPKTSSKTAAARMVTPSGESIFFLSERMRAVIPTEVAVDMIPRKRHFTSKRPEHSIPKTGRMNMAQPAPKKKETTTPPKPMIPPETEYLMKRERSVSRPEEKSKIIEAICENAYNSGETAPAKDSVTPKRPWGKPGRASPPSAKGPIMMPEISSPNTEGIPTRDASFPKIRAAKMMTAS